MASHGLVAGCLPVPLVVFFVRGILFPQVHVDTAFMAAVRGLLCTIPMNNCCFQHGDVPSQRDDFRPQGPARRPWPAGQEPFAARFALCCGRPRSPLAHTPFPGGVCGRGACGTVPFGPGPAPQALLAAYPVELAWEGGAQAAASAMRAHYVNVGSCPALLMGAGKQALCL